MKTISGHLAGGPATFSRDYRRFVDTVPRYAMGGSGQWLWCSDYKMYLDLVMALGEIPLGYADPDVTTAVTQAVQRGNSYTLSTLKEQLVAERLCDLTGFEAVRFTKTGSDAVVAAVRLARSINPPTRQKILVERNAYHGQHIQWKAPARGVLQSELESYVTFTWENLAEELPYLPWSEIAAVVVEYPMMDVSERLKRLRRWAQERKTIFILDEVVTFLRWPDNSVNNNLQLTADLMCVGKALGNGYSIGAVLGPKNLMVEFEPPDPVFISTTFGTEETGFSAALQVLNRVPFWAQLAEKGTQIIKSLPDNEWIKVIGQPCRSLYVTEKTPEVLWLWQRALLEAGVLANRPNYPSLAMGKPELDCLRSATEQALERMHSWLQDKPPAEYFRGPAAYRKPIPLFTPGTR